MCACGATWYINIYSVNMVWRIFISLKCYIFKISYTTLSYLVIVMRL